MKVPLPPEIILTNEMLRLVAAVDEFKGSWTAGAAPDPEKLQSLRQVATIESVGSSTRIEGSRLSDDEVEDLLASLEPKSFGSRDEEEVAGYAFVMDTVQTSMRDLELNESVLLQLHRDLLRYSGKDERHRGAWKTLPNHVSAFDETGEEIGVIFETATPFETPGLVRDLIDWLRREEQSPFFHSLLRIAVFKVAFLAIHPFQDGNGRLSRILTNLLLLKAGYSYVSFSSLESVIEHNKEAYYLALRRTQTSFSPDAADWEPWILFFLRSLKQQIERLEKRIAGFVEEGAPPVYAASGDELSPLAERLMHLLNSRKTLTVAEAVEALDANRNTLKGKFSELVSAGMARLSGKGRGAHYRPR